METMGSKAMQTIGKNIKNRRLELKMTVDEVAEKLNKNRATIYRYENGEIENLSVSVMIPLAKILHTTPAKLLGLEGENSILFGLKRKNIIKIDFKRDENIFVPYKIVLLKSGIYETFKNNQQSYNEWYFSLKIRLEDMIRTTKENFHILNEIKIPMFDNDDEEYSSFYTHDYLQSIKYNLNSLETLNDALNLLLEDDDNYIISEFNEIPYKDKISILKCFYPNYDYSSLDVDKIQEMYELFIKKCELENETFKKTLKKE